MEIASSRFSFNKTDGIKILKVFGWSAASAFIVFLISLVSIISVPPDYLWIVPIVNTLLVSIKQFVDGQKASKPQV